MRRCSAVRRARQQEQDLQLRFRADEDRETVVTIGSVGARSSQDAVIVIYRPSAQRGGGLFSAAADGCYRDIFRCTTSGSVTAERHTIECRLLLPEQRGGAELRFG